MVVTDEHEASQLASWLGSVVAKRDELVMPQLVARRGEASWILQLGEANQRALELAR
jgi:hypothetical protein